MKSGLILLLSMQFLSRFVTGQNLVTNPDFECGTDVCQFSEDPKMFATYFCDWWSPTGACPDMFTTSLGTSCFSGQPTNPVSGQEQPGTQLPHSGKRFAGIFTYGSTTGTPAEYREYISVRLTQPLTVGSYYRASMYVSCASNMFYASNNLGMCFLEGGFQFNHNGVVTGYQPQVVTKEVISSTQWVRVCGIFQATTPAYVVVIGNFSNDESTLANKVREGGADGYFYNAYYYIDDVSIEEISSPDPLSISVSGNTSICQNQPVSLSVSQPFDEITWTTLSDTTQVISTGTALVTSPQVTTTYRVQAKDCAYLVHDTVTVHVNPAPQISLGRDTTVCARNTLTLNAGSGFSSYLWQNNANSQDFSVTGPGQYSVTVTNQFACEDRASININYDAPPKVDLGKDTLVCSGFPLLRATNKESTYAWSSGSTDSVFTPTKAGKYWVTVQNHCGQTADTVQLFSLEDIFYPNVVTLNNDGLNEKFKVLGLGSDAQGSLQVFNRWGKIIFEDSSYHNDWPTSDDLPSGVYYFLLNFPGCPQNYKGWIEVLK